MENNRERDRANNITKRMFWRYVNVKLNRSIHHYHVFSVISMLFDEMLQDLKDGKEIRIFNFGSITLEDTKPRLYHDVTQRKFVLSKKHKILKFKLREKFKKIFLENIDVDKTFKGD